MCQFGRRNADQEKQECLPTKESGNWFFVDLIFQSVTWHKQCDVGTWLQQIRFKGHGNCLSGVDYFHFSLKKKILSINSFHPHLPHSHPPPTENGSSDAGGDKWVHVTRFVHHREYGAPSDAHTLCVNDGGAQQRSNGAIYRWPPSLKDVPGRYQTQHHTCRRSENSIR